MSRKLATAATLLVGALLTTSCAIKPAAEAETSGYPNTNMKMVVGFAAGGGTDIGARIISDGLKAKTGQTVVVENKPGAGGQVGNTALLSADPDGYTFGTVSLDGTILSYLDEARGAKYNAASFDPVALIVQDPQVFVVAPDSPIKSVDDLVARAKAEPNKIRVATTGIATQDHVFKVMFEKMTGTRLASVHFSEGSAPAMTAFLGGNVEVLTGNVGGMAEIVANGEGRILGVASKERNEFLPDAPTFKEQGYDLVLGSNRGFVVPAGTPDDVVEKLSAAIGDVMDDEETLAKLRKMGLTPNFVAHSEFREFWDETESALSDVLELVKADK